jgi:hypothetical protein
MTGAASKPNSGSPHSARGVTGFLVVQTIYFFKRSIFSNNHYFFKAAVLLLPLKGHSGGE